MYAKYKGTEFKVGDTIRVHYKLIEKEKISGRAKREVKEQIRERIQIFEGIVISIKGKAENKSFTVRRIGADNIGIERIFPLYSPWIEKITVVKKGYVRRAKLYYLRKKIGKEADKIKEKDKKVKIKKAIKKTSRKTSKKSSAKNVKTKK